jgi:hypothetical protein
MNYASLSVVNERLRISRLEEGAKADEASASVRLQSSPPAKALGPGVALRGVLG